MSPPEPDARSLIDAFVRRTGLTGDLSPRRYLWTDAYAVCTCLALHRHAQGDAYLGLARHLVEQVHHVLGRHRADDARTGWLSGLGDEDGERHPTAGGLRIGKPLPERAPGESYDRVLEWERDGQYFHYLTRWMHALARMAEVTGEPDYVRWAVELVWAAHAAFVTRSDDGRRLGIHWKMSVDLSRPLVPGSGAHDPLDGLVTCAHLRHVAASIPVVEGMSDLEEPIRDFAALCRGRTWHTDDPLGAGGLLTLLWRAYSLGARGESVVGLAVERLARSAIDSLDAVGRSGFLERPATHRLPFRELGLSLGLHALEALARLDEPRAPDLGVDPRRALRRWGFLAEAIEEFWTKDENRRAVTWHEHEDINAVMLAASLVCPR